MSDTLRTSKLYNNAKFQIKDQNDLVIEAGNTDPCKKESSLIRYCYVQNLYIKYKKKYSFYLPGCFNWTGHGIYCTIATSVYTFIKH